MVAIDRQVVEIILALEGSPASMAAATVLSTLLGGQAKFLNHREIDRGLNLSRQSLLVLPESQLNTLVKLRRYGFGGSVIVLSSKELNSLRDKHYILLWGAEAHEAWEISSPLPELLQKVDKLRPLGVNLLKKLRAELEMRPNQVIEGVSNALEKLQKPGANFDEEWTKVKAAIDKILKETPVVCHSPITVGDWGKKTIGRHLVELSDEIERSQGFSNHQHNDLHEVFEQWRERVIDSEEVIC